MKSDPMGTPTSGRGASIESTELEEEAWPSTDARRHLFILKSNRNLTFFTALFKCVKKDNLRSLPMLENCMKHTLIKDVCSWKNKVSLQTSLERNPTNLLYIFILSVNFENLTVRLHVLITSLMLTKFKKIKDQLLCHQINVIISSFYNLKLYIKNKLMIK